MSSSKQKKFKLQLNEPIKKTYIPNKIRIPTHRYDLWHHGLRMEYRRQKSPMKPPQGKRGGGRKNESRKKEKKGRELFMHANSFDVTKSRHVRRHDLYGVTEST
jgi:hypothetical protein